MQNIGRKIFKQSAQTDLQTSTMCNLIELILNTEKACFVLYIDKETTWVLESSTTFINHPEN